MSLVTRYLLPCVVLIAVVVADDLILGTTVNGQLVYVEAVKLSAIPSKIRTENVFFNDINNRPIKGITAIDMEKKGAQATVTAGGLGSSFVNIRLTSKMGEGLDYRVRLFV